MIKNQTTVFSKRLHLNLDKQVYDLLAFFSDYCVKFIELTSLSGKSHILKHNSLEIVFLMESFHIE